MEMGISAPAMSGYEAFNFARPQIFQSSASRGGVTVYVARRVAPHVSVYQSDCTDSVIVLRVGRDSRYFDRDLYLLVTYIAPRDDTVISMATRKVWEELEKMCQFTATFGPCLDCGRSKCAQW